MPDTISEPAKLAYRALLDFVERRIATQAPALPGPDDQTGWREAQNRFASLTAQVFGTLPDGRFASSEAVLDGVPAIDIKPALPLAADAVIVYLHGGGYVFGSARLSLPDAVSMAELTGYRTLSIDYTLAPHAKWQQITDEVARALHALQSEGYAARRIALCGDSAGGSLAAGAVLKMRDQGYALPGAVVLRSPWSDIAEIGDTYETLQDADPMLCYRRDLAAAALAYARTSDHRHPYVSPVYGDYSKGFPPTLIQGGTRDIFVSNCVRHFQALESCGVPAKLDLYEGMPHVFQKTCAGTPEADLAMRKLRDFLRTHIPA
ncbi:MAG TPA: alpha/beta hydrolase [Steroidobacteraceae bacterium]